MNFLSIITIMILLSFKLNALEGINQNDPKLKEIADFIKKAKDPKEYEFSPYYHLIKEEELRNDRICSHCPKYLLLTEKINKVVEKMAADPGLSRNAQLPVKINKLKFMFYTQFLQNQNGEIQCKRYMDITPDLKPTKFDGQFILMAEDVLKFSEVTEIQYMNPELKEMVYYFRGEGADKNIIVQAILNQTGGRFKYYQYTPSERESNPYNLPDLGAKPDDSSKSEVGLTDYKQDKIDSGNQGLKANEGYSIKFKTEVEKRNKYIPKNVHFVDAQLDQEISDGIKLKANSDTSLKGNEANLAIKNGDKDLVKVYLHTKLNGETDHEVRVPYAIRVSEQTGSIGVKGEVAKINQNDVLSMVLTDNIQDFVRAEFRKNNDTSRTSYVFSKDIKFDGKETLSLQLGKGEDDKRYASLKHMKSIKDNTTMVLEVRVDQDKRATLFYQLNSRF